MADTFHIYGNISIYNCTHWLLWFVFVSIQMVSVLCWMGTAVHVGCCTVLIIVSTMLNYFSFVSHTTLHNSINSIRTALAATKNCKVQYLCYEDTRITCVFWQQPWEYLKLEISLNWIKVLIKVTHLNIKKPVTFFSEA